MRLSLRKHKNKPDRGTFPKNRSIYSLKLRLTNKYKYLRKHSLYQDLPVPAAQPADLLPFGYSLQISIHFFFIGIFFKGSFISTFLNCFRIHALSSFFFTYESGYLQHHVAQMLSCHYTTSHNGYFRNFLFEIFCHCSNICKM